MKQIENTLQDLKCMLIEDGYTEANIVLRTLIKTQEQVKNNDLLHSVVGSYDHCNIVDIVTNKTIFTAPANMFEVKFMEFKITFVGSTGLNEDISIKARSFADAEKWFIKYKSLEDIVNIKKTK